MRNSFARGLSYVAIFIAKDLEKVALQSPIRPDHFIHENFTYENNTITIFYHNFKANLVLMRKFEYEMFTVYHFYILNNTTNINCKKIFTHKY